ncbi:MULTISPECIES: penicillin-binding protein activator LpoB [unclassified Oceanispirochaeta]|uniref:penicillin-binding protein activator LpoB n=1 Tax=unclassified Oceanispirochaeta TaxID=2635722 RepID=UPI000E095B6B|nr:MULTISPECIES: penicillin-binding protein activator LpoB [unclassified Oceanispirochaeta]MBF9014590.1 penicillin-binding protein activator LpoB [Oceanispirochaeta sp. M2]NPD70846.1 penicillin-binding protein activator LpoB [Oceanispirochaeta sp. M1]RDG34127.1 penicillin-binding protein activator LpoB [Oceanispirochaeta sp. M1]
MKRLLVLILAIVSLAGCASTKVTRTSSDEVIDLSGRWNDTDSRLTAEEIVSDCLSRPWIDDYLAENGEKPVVIVGSVRNKSSEHIEVLTFIKDIERELINSGRVRFVASAVEREEVREEREDQQSNSTEETANALAAETGADYMMQGVITSITDAVEGKKVIKYQVSMELIHLQTNEKAWIGENEVKKLIKQSKSKW